MEAEQARTRSEAEHRKTAANYNSCISHMRQLEKKLKRSINKSRSQPLFYSPRTSLLGPRSVRVCLCVCLCVRVGNSVDICVIWCSPDVSCVGLRSAGVGSRGKSPGMRVLTEECYSSSSFLQRQLTLCLLPHALPLLSFSPCRPYFELKAKYYLQLEVCILPGF